LINDDGGLTICESTGIDYARTGLRYFFVHVP
jgi:hypothetical protein